MTQSRHVAKFILIPLLLPIFSSLANNLNIYRAGFRGRISDSFQTTESVCTGTSPSCLDYNALLNSCKTCQCTSSNDTFGYMKDSWRCLGKEELRQATGCYVDVKNQQPDQATLLYVATSNNWIYLNLPLHLECTYNYTSDTYYRACDGSWSAAGSIGSGTRYALHKVNDQQDRKSYWIRVQTDAIANRFFEGRIMKLNLECKKNDIPTWKGCFIFKESYVARPVSCPSAFTTVNTSASPNISYPPLPKTTPSFVTTEEPTASSYQPSNEFLSMHMSTPNSTSNNQASKGAGIHKNIIIGVSAAAGVLLVVIVTVICIVCSRRRQRSDISKYTAALYRSSQDHGSAGVYAETSIRLPSTSKPVTAGSHSNPAYELGRDMSVTIAHSRASPSPSQLQPTSPRFEFSNSSFEGETPDVPRAAKPRPTVKQRGNMLIKYENVTILSDQLRPESVPDAERFYDNPGGHSPEYYVLENTEEVPSYGTHPAGPQIQDNSTTDFPRTSLEKSLNQTESYTNDVTEPDEPIYMNSPAILSSDPRDSTVFSFDTPKNELDSQAVSLKTIDYGDSDVDEDEDMYANSEAIRDSYLDSNAAENTGYESDDDEHDDEPIEEPIYDNQSAMNERDGHAHAGDSPLLNNQSDDAMYQDLASSRARYQESDYQSLTPVTSRKTPPKTNPKPKPTLQQQR